MYKYTIQIVNNVQRTAGLQHIRFTRYLVHINPDNLLPLSC